MTYRVPAVLPHEPVARHVGPRTKCPACGHEAAKAKFANGPHGGGLFGGGCKEEGPHLHQGCDRCGGEWICAPLERGAW